MRSPSGYLLLTTIALWCSALAASPISIDPINPHYFLYNGQTIALVGASAEYLGHVSCITSPDPSCEVTSGGTILSDYYCRYENYNAYLSDLSSKHLNKMQIWIGLNHSPGWQRLANPTLHSYAKPYDYEQPWSWDSSAGKWTYISSPIFWSHVRALLAAARAQGIIVEVTLFDAFSGNFAYSPWNPASNTYTGYGFTAEQYMVSFDNPSNFDVISSNHSARVEQSDAMLQTLVQTAASQLNSFDNFYWEIANEPEIDGTVTAASTLTWHDSIARDLYYRESTLPNGHHLIAAQLHSRTAIESIKSNNPAYPNLGPNIKIVNAHYVTVANGTPDPYGAIPLIRDYNNGPQGQLNRLFGFNEGRITPDVAYPSNPNQDLSTRAEAWEFMLEGGGTFDHLGYDWRNNPVSISTRTYLGKLADFLKTLTLRTMNRQLSGTQLAAFVYGGLPAYGAGNVYWGGMQSSDQKQFVLYVHHSTLSPNAYTRYRPILSTYNTTLQLQQLGAAGTFKAEWIDPATGAVKGTPQTFAWSGAGIITLQASPSYVFDIALRITRQ